MDLTEIRAAGDGDVSTLARLADQLGYPSAPEQIRARLETLSRLADHAAFVAERQGRVVGLVHVFVHASVLNDPCAEIGGLVVDEELRGRRIGAALLAACERWAAERGLREVLVRSNLVREAAHRFYEREGYRRRKAQAVLFKRL